MTTYFKQGEKPAALRLGHLYLFDKPVRMFAAVASVIKETKSDRYIARSVFTKYCKRLAYRL